MNKIKKFCANNKKEILLAGISVTVGLACATLHNSLMKGVEIESAYFDPYNSDVDESAHLTVVHKNGKTTNIDFVKNV